MFTINFDDNEDRVSICFRNELIDIEFVPEDCFAISDDGFDSMSSNGEFSFRFNEEKITFYIGKYGDGKGGSFSLSLKMTKEIKESLDNVMSKWREVYNEIYSMLLEGS